MLLTQSFEAEHYNRTCLCSYLICSRILQNSLFWGDIESKNVKHKILFVSLLFNHPSALFCDTFISFGNSVGLIE